ncbi:MAG: hypothetical protein NZ744_07600 [Pirellulaceae bacterium]|nr:hypothetical protein [Pirellulaceae bacterium]
MIIKTILSTLTIAALLAATAQTVSAQQPERPQGQQAQRPQGGPADFIERIKGFDQNNDGKITKDEMPERMQAMIERLDTNKDGAIDNKELAALKDRLAQGGQGQQGQRPQGQRPEGQQGQRPEGQRPEGQQGQRPQFNPADIIKRVKESDKNKDGKITKDEFPVQMQRMFPRIDTNQDGAIDREELAVMEKRMAERGGQRPQGQPGQRPDAQPGQRPQGQPGQRPDAQPGQGRGLPPLPVLQALDTNQDGEISGAEIANAVKALKSLDKDGNGKLTMEELMPARGQREREGGQPGQGGRPDGFRPDSNGRPSAAGQGGDRPQRPARPE